MSYRLERHETPEEGVKRIAREQIDKALADIRNDEDRDEGVHEGRKRFKKVRGLIRLVRDEVGDDFYKSVNVRFRDMGRALSDLRDAQVMVETVDELVDHFEGQLEPDAFSTARSVFQERHDAMLDRFVNDRAVFDKVEADLIEARDRVEDWPIDSDGFAAFSDGLERVYRRGRDGFEDSYDSCAVADFHDWRKRVKYLWYHMRVLEDAWDDMVDEIGDQGHDLSDHIGDDHDLAVLISRLAKEPDTFGGETEVEALIALARSRSRELREAAYPLARRIYVEKPKRFVKRIEGYWNAWRDDRPIIYPAEPVSDPG